jgi:hypothetical protein
MNLGDNLSATEVHSLEDFLRKNNKLENFATYTEMLSHTYGGYVGIYTLFP